MFVPQGSAQQIEAVLGGITRSPPLRERRDTTPNCLSHNATCRIIRARTRKCRGTMIAVIKQNDEPWLRESEILKLNPFERQGRFFDIEIMNLEK
jgi:hypothetical protein